MNARLTLPIQWSLALLIGLILGYVFQPIIGTTLPILITPTEPTSLITPSPAPFITLPGGWLVRVTFYRQAAPHIDKVIHLDQARLTTLLLGDNQIQILNATSQTIFSQSFQVEFLAGDPPHPVDTIEMVLVLPALEGASQIVIQTSNGKAVYDLPTK